MNDGPAESPNPLTTLSVFFRITYENLLTVIVLSVLTALAAIPVLTLGAGILASVDTMRATLGVDGPAERPRTQTDRLSYFADAFAENLLQGVLFGPLLVGVTLLALQLVGSVFATGSAVVVGLVIGVYALVLTIVWLFRAASVTLDAADPPGPVGCLGDALSHLGGDISLTSLQTMYAATLWLGLAWTRIGVILLLTGLLAVLEVVTYAERSGAGASSLVDDATG